MNSLISTEKIQTYLNNLSSQNLTSEAIHKKLTSVVKFIDWAFEKGKVDEYQYEQMKEFVANKQNALIGNNPDKTTSSIPNKLNAYRTALHLSSIPFTHLFSLRSPLILFLSFLVVSVAVSASLGRALFQPENLVKSSLMKLDGSRSLAVSARLTDAVGNAITTKTDVTFKLYNTLSGGTPLYSGTCQGENALTPDKNGSFTTIIGKDCGMKEIKNTIFIDNPSIYLGIRAGDDAEMSPRQQIANVGYSLVAQSLQGLPLGADNENVAYINDQGNLLISSKKAGIHSTSTSANFSITSAKTLTLQSSTPDLFGDGIILQATQSGNIKFRTGGIADSDVRLFIDNSLNGGNIGVGTVNPVYKFDVATSTDGVSGRFAGRVKGANGSASDEFVTLSQLQGGPGSLWLDGGTYIYPNPLIAKNTSLPQGKLAIGAAVGDFSLLVSGEQAGKALAGFNYTGTDQNILVASQSGTLKFSVGNQGNITSASGAKWMPTSNGTSALGVANASGSLFVNFDSNNGRVGIGTTAPSGKLQVKESDAKTYTNYAGYLENTSTNSDTDDIDKYGLYLTSTGTFTGSSGTATNNYGLYIKTTAGADNNYDIYAESGANLDVGGTWNNASSRELKTNFTDVDYEEILSKINQLDLQQWSYKKETPSIVHLGPIAEDFFSLFGLGGSNKSISTVDPAGVALAGIKALTVRLATLQEKVNQIDNFTSDIISSFTAKFDNVTVHEKLVSPLVETKDIIATGTAQLSQISTKDIKPQEQDLVINLNKDESSANPSKGKLAELIIKGLEDKTVATIDEQGNASFSGTLTAKQVNAQNITNLENSYQSLQSSVTTQNQTAQELKNKSQEMNTKVKDIEQLLADIKNQPVKDAQYYQTLPDEGLGSERIDFLGHEVVATGLSLTEGVNAYTGYFVDSLTAGNLEFKDNQILSLTSELKLTALSNINFFDGKVMISNDGTITSQGEIIAQKGVRTNVIQPIHDGDNIGVELNNPASHFQILTSGQETASIDASGSGTFNRLTTKNLSIQNKYFNATSSATIIAAADNLTKNGLYAPAIETDTQTAGVGTIPGNSSEVVIYNESIEESSLIYLTPISTSLVKNLTLVQKETCSQQTANCRPYFKVAVDKNDNSVVEFNWLIID